MEEVEEEKRKETSAEQEHDDHPSSWFDRVDLALADPKYRPVLEAEIAYNKELRRIEEDSQEIARTLAEYAKSPSTDEDIQLARNQRTRVEVARVKQLQRDREIAEWRYACAKPYIEEHRKEPWRKRLAYLESLPDVLAGDIANTEIFLKLVEYDHRRSTWAEEEPKVEQAEEIALTQAASQEQ